MKYDVAIYELQVTMDTIEAESKEQAEDIARENLETKGYDIDEIVGHAFVAGNDVEPYLFVPTLRENLIKVFNGYVEDCRAYMNRMEEDHAKGYDKPYPDMLCAAWEKFGRLKMLAMILAHDLGAKEYNETAEEVRLEMMDAENRAGFCE